MGYSTPIWSENAPFVLFRPFVHPNNLKNLNELHRVDPQPPWHASIDFWPTTRLKPGSTPKTMGYSTLIFLENALCMLFRAFVDPNSHENLNEPH